MRAAAWTVPVVSIAAAAPAYALTTEASIGSAANAVRYSLDSRRHIEWDLTMKNGPKAIKSITLNLSYTPETGNLNTEAFQIFNYLQPSVVRDDGWTSTILAPLASAARVRTVHNLTTIPARSTTLIHTRFRGADNSSGIGSISGTAAIVYEDNTTSSLPIGARWATGVAHIHP